MSYLGRSAKLSLKAQEKVSFLATAGQTVKTGLSYTVGFIEVYVNGVLLTDTTDFTATNGSSVTFTVALLLNDEVTVISLKTFTVADHYNKTEADTLLAAKSPIASPAFTGGIDVTGSVTSDGVVTSENIEIAKASYPALKLNDGTAFSNIYHSPVNGGVVISVDDGNALASSDLITYIDGTEKMRLDSSGHAIIGGGVTLGNGTTYAAANTLDDYEEGTFTAVVTMGSGTATVSSSSNTLYYTKVGNLCTIGGQFQISSVSSPSGTFNLTLPFTVKSGTLTAGSYRTYLVDTPNDGTSNVLYSDNNVAVFVWSRDNSSSTNENATSGGHYMIGLTYFTT